MGRLTVNMWFAFHIMCINTNGNLLYERDRANSSNVDNSLHGISTEMCVCQHQTPYSIYLVAVLLHELPEVQYYE